jgi:hypothetical protein
VVENTRRKKEREIKLRYRYTGGAICDLNPSNDRNDSPEKKFEFF